MGLDAGVAGWWCRVEIFGVLFTKVVCVILPLRVGWVNRGWDSS